jgi:hypothetical protein
MSRLEDSNIGIRSDINYVRQYPTSSRIATNFNGELNFNFIVPNNKVLVLEDSEIVLQLDLNQFGGGGVASADLTPGLSNSPLSCFFSRAEIHLANKKVWEMTEFTQMSTIHQTLTQSPTELEYNNSGNPITYDGTDVGSTTVAEDSAANEIAAETNRVAIANLQAIAYRKTGGSVALKRHITFSAKLPVNIRRITGNTEVTIKFIIDRKYPQNLFMAGATFAQVIQVLPTVPNTPGTNDSIGLSVTDVFMNLKMFTADRVFQSESIPFSFGQYTADTKAVISTTENLIFTSARNPSHIGFFFFDNSDLSVANNQHLSPTHFRCNATNVLDEFQIEYAGNHYPSNTMYVNFDPFDQDQKETVKAYREFLHSIRGLSKIPVMSYRQWRKTPIIVYRVTKPMNDLNTTVRLRLRFSAAPTTSNICFFSYYQNDCSINYDPNGNVSEVLVAEVV